MTVPVKPLKPWDVNLIKPARVTYGRRRTYSSSMRSTFTTNTALSTQDIACLWHPSSCEKKVEIVRVQITTASGAGGRARFRMRRAIISTAFTFSELIQIHDRDDVKSEAFFYNAPINTYDPDPCDYATWVMTGANSNILQWDATQSLGGKPITLRPFQAEGLGFEHTIDVVLTTATNIMISVTWTEEDP